MARCATCGLDLTQVSGIVCPRCGQSLAAAPPAQGAGNLASDEAGSQPTCPLPAAPGMLRPSPDQGQPVAAPGSGWAMPSISAVPTAPTLPAYPAMPASMGVAAPSSGAPSDAMPPAPPAPPAAPAWPSAPGYGATPSGYSEQAYGQYAPAKVPPPPGKFPPGLYPLGYAPAPPAARRISRPWLAAAIAVAVLLVLGLGILGALDLMGQVTTGTTSPATSTTVARGVTATPQSITVYHSALGAPTAGWANDSHCFFGGGGYHIKYGYLCFAPAGPLATVNVTVTAKLVSGSLLYAYGIVLRRPAVGQYYEFGIDGNGKWVFLKCVSPSQDCARLVDFTANPAITKGYNALNTLSVRASGAHFTFSINGTRVGTADDTTYASGGVGIAGDYTGEVIYTNISITRPAAGG